MIKTIEQYSFYHLIKQIKHLKLKGLVLIALKPDYKINVSFMYFDLVALWFSTNGALVHVNKIIPLRAHSSEPSLQFSVTWKVQRERCRKNGLTSVLV